MSFINSVCSTKIFGGVKKALKTYEYMVFDPKYVDTLEKNLKKPEMGLHESFKNAYSVTKEAAGGENLFKRIGNSFKGFFGEFGKAGEQIKNIKASKYASKLTFGKKLMKYLKPIGKRMPMIQNLLAVAFSIPTIYSAFSKGGFTTGLKETGKEIFKLGLFTLGGAVGGALGGPIGGIAGSMGAAWLGDKIFGKSFSDQQDEAEEKQAQTTTQANPQAQQTQTAQKTQTAETAETTPQAQAALAQQYNPALAQSIMDKPSMATAQSSLTMQQAYAKAGINPNNFFDDSYSQAMMPQQFSYNSYNSGYSSNPFMANQSSQYGLNISSNPFMKKQLQGTNNNAQYGMNQAMGSLTAA